MNYNTNIPGMLLQTAVVTRPPNVQHRCSTPAANAHRETPLSSRNRPPQRQPDGHGQRGVQKVEDPCFCTIFSTFLPHLFTLFSPFVFVGLSHYYGQPIFLEILMLLKPIFRARLFCGSLYRHLFQVVAL